MPSFWCHSMADGLLTPHWRLAPNPWLPIKASTIGELLDSAGLGQYTEKFEAERINLRSVQLLSDADLRELGLALGERRTFMQLLVVWDCPLRSVVHSLLLPPHPPAHPRCHPVNQLYCTSRLRHRHPLTALSPSLRHPSVDSLQRMKERDTEKACCQHLEDGTGL